MLQALLARGPALPRTRLVGRGGSQRGRDRRGRRRTDEEGVSWTPGREKTWRMGAGRSRPAREARPRRRTRGASSRRRARRRGCRPPGSRSQAHPPPPPRGTSPPQSPARSSWRPVAPAGTGPRPDPPRVASTATAATASAMPRARSARPGRIARATPWRSSTFVEDRWGSRGVGARAGSEARRRRSGTLESMPDRAREAPPSGTVGDGGCRWALVLFELGFPARPGRRKAPSLALRAAGGARG